MTDLSEVAKRVREVYPQCRDARAAFRIALCALSREHCEHLLMYQVGRRSCVEIVQMLKIPLDRATMSVDELCRLMARADATESRAQDNPYVSEMLENVEKALTITMQAPASKRVWTSMSVKLLVCFAMLLEMTGPVLDKLFGHVGRSDMRRLELIQDDWHGRRLHSDAHLNALNHIVNVFVKSL